MRSKQLLLGTVAPKQTVGAKRFQDETLRRGGPFEVQGRRWSASTLRRRQKERELSEQLGEAGWVPEMPHLKRM